MAAAPARAWGPRTHVVLNEAALARLARVPATAFLAREPYREIFRRAGPVADLTLDVSAGGKRDVAINTLLHSAPFLRFLVLRARATGDRERWAFALGLAAHRAADRVANAPGAVVCRNSFAWPRDRDEEGRPVGDPQASLAGMLRYPTVSLNKMMVDALLARGRPPGGDDAPAFDPAFLAGALAAYRGPGAVGRGEPGEEAAWLARLTEMEWRFRLSTVALGGVTAGMAGAEGVRAGMVEALGGDGLGIPGLATAVEHVAGAVEDLARGRPVREGRIPPLPPGAAGLLPVRPRRLGPDRYRLTDGAARLYAAFAGAALAQGASWESVRAAVRDAILAPSGAGPLPGAAGAGRPASAFSPEPAR